MRLHGLTWGLLAMLLMGCESDRSEQQSSSTRTETDYCKMAMAAVDKRDASAVTKAIVAENTHLEPLLERIGWNLIDQGRATLDPGFYQQAEWVAHCMQQHAPASRSAQALLAHALNNQHRFGDAERLARRLIETRGYWLDYALLGDALVEQGRVAAAAQAYQAMMAQRPGPQAYIRAAHMRWLTGDLDGAIEVMAMAARSSGANAVGWIQNKLANYHWQAGNTSLAEQWVDRALTHNSDYAPALLTRGRLLLAAGQATVALQPLRQAAAAVPLPEYQWPLIDALELAGKRDEANRVQQALLREGGTGDPRGLALYLATGGLPDTDTRDGTAKQRALELLARELRQRADVHTLDAMAWALFSAGQTQTAWDYMQKALVLGTKDPRLALHASAIAARLGAQDQAESWWAEACRQRNLLLPSERRWLNLARSEATNGRPSATATPFDPPASESRASHCLVKRVTS